MGTGAAGSDILDRVRLAARAEDVRSASKSRPVISAGGPTGTGDPKVGCLPSRVLSIG